MTNYVDRLERYIKATPTVFTVYALVVYDKKTEDAIGVGFYPKHSEAQESLEFHVNWLRGTKYTYKIKQVSLDSRDIVELKETPELRELAKKEIAVVRLLHHTFPTEAHNEPLLLRGKELASSINKLVVERVSKFDTDGLLRGIPGFFAHHRKPSLKDEAIAEVKEAIASIRQGLRDARDGKVRTFRTGLVDDNSKKKGRR